MGRKKNTIHYLYKITCNLTGRWYIGMHSTNNLNDGYMGSGKRLRYSLNKYGVDNHTKEILEFFETRELLVEAEKMVITEDMINDSDCMNLCGGGSGGHGARFLTREQLVRGRELCDKILEEKYGDDFKRTIIKNYHNNLTDEEKLKRSEIIKNRQKEVNFNHNTFEGKSHSEETRQKMRKSKNKGSSNSQFGTCWITKDGINKKIKKEELNTYAQGGWTKGRK